MTLDGTNTWILAEPGADRAVVVDPGPLHEGHLQAVLAVAEMRGSRVGLVLLTHGHADHAEGAARLATLAGGVPVRALDPAHRLGQEGLGDGDVVTVDGLEVVVVATPGHTVDSLSFVLSADGAVLTGDTVLGRGTTVVAWPDGKLADYLDSLRRLRSLAESGQVSTVLPGHGPVLTDQALMAIDHYLEHRADRLAQVEAALVAGDRTPAEIVRRVYADVDPAVWPAAELSVRAQLEYLRDGGRAKS
jgi:glyoxylase-like metal-dependent hydrolase (beta-lactamase superfamily II)